MSGLLSNRLGVPLFLTRIFHLKELHMLNRGHRNGLSSCRLGCHLGSRFGCTLGGFGTRFGSRFGRGLQPLWHAVCLRNIAGENTIFRRQKHLPTPYTTSTLCPHTHALSLSSSTPFGRPLSTDISDDTSDLLQSVRHGMPALTRTLKNQCHHYHFPMNLPEMVKEGWKEG